MVRVAALSVLVLASDVSFVSAQSNPRVRGPFAGLFGGGPEAQQGQSLNLRGSVFGAWQEVLIPANFDRSQLDPTFDATGTFGGAIASLDYFFNRRSSNSAIFLAGRGWASDYSISADVPQYGAEATTGFSHNRNLTRRMVWSSSATAGYSPYFNFAPIPLTNTIEFTGLPIAVTPGLGVGAVNASNVQVSGTTGVTENLSKRSAIAANLFYQQVFFFSNSQAGLTQLGSGLTYNYRIFRRLNFHAGYHRSQARLSGGWSEPVQYADVGLDYGDAFTLRLTRRTRLTFATSLGSARSVPKGATQYQLLGNATLTHTMGRTWYATLAAARGLGFVAVFRQPVLTDSVTGSIGGQLATRVSWTSSASLLRGYIGLDQSRHYDASNATSVLSIGLTRRLGAFAQYSYYRNRLPKDAIPLSVLTNFDRQTASVGLTLYQPIFNTQRTR